jgi:hypothetical protein
MRKLYARQLTESSSRKVNTARIADWEELSKPVWNQMEFVIKRLDNRYAKAHSWEKFEALDEAHSSIATLAKAVNDLYTQTTCT